MNNRTLAQSMAAVAGNHRTAIGRLQLRIFSAGITVVILTMLGCTSDALVLVDAGGTVTYQGAPVSGANVVFISEEGARTAIGYTDDEGQFRLTTGGRDGAVLGAHKVAISAVRLKGPVSVNMSTEEILANEEYLIPREYASVNSSGLTATVAEDPAQNQFDFALP